MDDFPLSTPSSLCLVAISRRPGGGGGRVSARCAASEVRAPACGATVGGAFRALWSICSSGSQHQALPTFRCFDRPPHTLAHLSPIFILGGGLTGQAHLFKT